MKESVKKTSYLLVTLGIILGVWYVYAFVKSNAGGRSELGKCFMQNITKLTRGVEYDVVIFQGEGIRQIRNNFPSGVEVVEYNPKDDMVKVRERMKDKTFLLMWEIGEDYRLPDMTRKYRLFFSNHKKTLYAPFEQEATKRFAWQNSMGINVQYYLFEKPQSINFDAIKHEEEQQVQQKAVSKSKPEVKDVSSEKKDDKQSGKAAEVKSLDKSSDKKAEQKKQEVSTPTKVENKKLEDKKTVDNFKTKI